MVTGPPKVMGLAESVLEQLARTHSLPNAEVRVGLWGQPMVRLYWDDASDLERNIIVHVHDDEDLIRMEVNVWRDDEVPTADPNMPPEFERHWSHAAGEGVRTDRQQVRQRLEREVDRLFKNAQQQYGSRADLDQTVPLDLSESDRRLLTTP